MRQSRLMSECVIGVMVDGNVCVQCMMGDVVHG